MTTLVSILRILFRQGPPPHPHAYRYQGFSRASDLFSEYQRTPGWLVNFVCKLILFANFFRPQVWMDTLLDWIHHKKGRREGEVTGFREAYYVARATFFTMSLLLWSESYIVSAFVLWFLYDVLLELMGEVLVWGRFAVSPRRSMMLSLMFYGEVTVAFAIFYLCLNCFQPTGTPLQALYFSVSVAATLGYLPKCTASPNADPVTLILVMGQSAIFVLFALVFVNTFTSRSLSERK